jgi:hypothetical protein
VEGREGGSVVRVVDQDAERTLLCEAGEAALERLRLLDVRDGDDDDVAVLEQRGREGDEEGRSRGGREDDCTVSGLRALRELSTYR